MAQFQQTVFKAGSDESLSVRTALATARMNWQALLKPVFVEDQESLGGFRAIDGHSAVTRSDNGRSLGVVGSQFTPVQNDYAFDWIQPVLDAGEARIISAGELGGGKRVYVQAELSGSRSDVTPGDTVFSSIVFANGHDGSLAASAGYSCIRVVCQNTMMAAARSLAFKAKHTAGVHLKLEEARLEFSEQREALAKRSDLFRFLTTKKLSDKSLVRYVRESLVTGAGNDSEKVVRGVDEIVRLAHEAPGAAPGTLWGGFNALTYWATHSRGRSDDARANSLMFGNGGQAIERALEVAVQYADKLPSAEQGFMASQNFATATADFGALLNRPARIASEQETA